MPTYEYECTRCDHAFEEFKPMSAPKRQRCPKCRGKVERLISGGLGIHFKGQGFYVTDSRGKNKSPDGTTSGNPASETPAASKPANGKTTPSSGSGNQGNDNSNPGKNKA